MTEIKDPIVSMVEFQGRLWLATTKGIFVKRRTEDVFAPVEMIPAPVPAPIAWDENGPVTGPVKHSEREMAAIRKADKPLFGCDG